MPNESVNIYLSAKDGISGVFAARDGNRHEKAPAGPGRSLTEQHKKEQDGHNLQNPEGKKAVYFFA